MNIKKEIYLVLILLVLVSLSAVSAVDDSTSDIISTDSNELILDDSNIDVASANDEIILEESTGDVDISNEEQIIDNDLSSGQDEVLATDEGTFAEIQNKIDNANDGDTINLDGITYYGSGEELKVNKSLTFIGKNTVLNALNQSAIFNIDANAFSVTFKNIVFTEGSYNNNYSVMNFKGSDLKIINCTVINIRSIRGILVNNFNANVTVLNSSFLNSSYNETKDAALVIFANNTIIDNCIFSNNMYGTSSSGDAGVAIYGIINKTIIKNTLFSNNTKTYNDGGIIYLTTPNLTMFNTSFYKNTLWTSSSLLYLHNEHSQGDQIIGPHNIFFSSVSINIDNCSFTDTDERVDDFPKYGVHVMRSSTSQAATINLTMTNSNFENNTFIAIYSYGSENVYLENCSFKDNNGGFSEHYYNCNFTYFIKSCSFENNSKFSAIALKLRVMNFTLSDCNFTNNAYHAIEGNAAFVDVNLSNCNFENSEGVYINELNNTFLVNNCSFISNHKDNGGAIYIKSVNNASVQLTNSKFDNNTATYGGAIYLNGTSNSQGILIENSTFKNQEAIEGGIIWLNDTSDYTKKINNCSFANNTHNKDLTNRLGRYGLYIFANNVSLTNSQFENNSAYGEGVGAAEGAAFNVRGDYTIVANCSFINNSANSCGVGILYGNNTVVINCTFINNTAKVSQGAMNIDGEYGTVKNCSFINNGILLSPIGKPYAGALSFNSKHGIIDNCTFDKNYIVMDSEGETTYRIASSALEIGRTDVTLKNSNFKNNYFGENITHGEGTLCISIAGNDTNVTIMNCNFTNNSAICNDSAGSAIEVYRSNNTYIINCNFENNTCSGGYIKYFVHNYVGGAIYYNSFAGEWIHHIINSTFKDNKVSSRYLNVSDENGFLSITFEGYENYINAIFFVENDVNVTIVDFQNVTYGDGENEYNTDDVAPVLSTLEANQPIVIEVYDSSNVLVDNVTTKTDQNGRVLYQYTKLPDGAYTYKVYHPDNAYYTYIDANGSFVLDRMQSNLLLIINDMSYDDEKIATVLSNIIGNITIDVNGTLYDLEITASDGGEKQIVLDRTISLGTYIAKAIFDGNIDYTPISDQTIFTIYKGQSQISVNTTIVYEGNDAIIDYESHGDMGIRIVNITNGTSTLKEGTDYNVKSIGDGKIVLTGLKIGAYTIYLETIVDGNHIGSSNQTGIIVKSGTSFSALQDLIDHATDSVTLDRDYAFDPEVDSSLTKGILVNKDMVIYGAGFTIDGNYQARIFNITNGAHATIRDLTLQNGKIDIGGGAIFNAATLSVINITFKDNEGYNGGAFYNNRSCYATIDDCRFINNNGSAGGVISNVGTLVVDNSLFDNNNASNKGGAISNFRGTLTVLNSNFTNNYAYLNGGAIVTDQGTAFIDNTFICNNTARRGGGICTNNSVSLNNSALQSNSATNGSDIWTNRSEDVTLIDVRFVDSAGNSIYSGSGTVDTSDCIYLTAVAFEIADIDDFVNGSTILVQVRETLKGEAFNGIVAFSIGGNNYTMDIVNGVGSMNVTPYLSFGKYAVKLSFDETAVYYKAFAESNQFHVSNHPLLSIEDISNFVTGSSVTIKVSALDTFNGVVDVLIDGVAYAVNLVNGTGSKTVALNLKAGSYNATIDYPGNENFTADYVVSNVFTVSKKSVVIAASAVTATYNVNKYLVATLKDNAGKLLTGVKVTIKLSNGKTFSQTTDKKGQVKLLVSNLLPKAYTATITFAGNDYYAKASKSVKVTVKKASPKMTAKAKTFKVKVKVKKYKITLKTNKNKVMKNTKVTLKVNKKTFTAKTNKKGIATFKITNLKKKGKFTAVIKYVGSKYYNKLTKKAKITVKA